MLRPYRNLLFAPLLALAMVSQNAPAATPRVWHLNRPAQVGAKLEAVSGHGTAVYEADGALSFPVGEGNWLVTVELGDAKATASTTIKAENRRLMLLDAGTKRGETVVKRFVVHVHNADLGAVPENAPGAAKVRLRPDQAAQRNWDHALTLEMLGRPALRQISIEPAQVPTLFLVGDSMVADHPTEPTASWGQMLPAMVDENVAVANYAESGATLKSFLADLRLDKALSLMKAGDYLFIQFGHNDQKAQWPQTYAEAGTTYRAYLAAYIAEARRRGAYPVLVTSPERRNFDAQGHIVPSLGDYPQAMRALGAELNVPVIDLNRASITLYEALGPDKAPEMFNDGGKDRTHYNNWGAWMAARIIADGIRAALPALAPHLTVPRFDPAHPQAITIPASKGNSSQRPLGN
ncbi:rhamnogalacturonan acetylesterase [Novosphingobium umbonatum]|uniref:Rhamnogalacturonan acetylesterase n=1 Tax=Novosphingobium umbonatum TaxID=1908524 RepID=A0A437N3L8_9SPHN|nr:rhamnogalacturonan acetylesterase [Novosphingobium umbonatum]RVU04507.1 rhamnogalacturonan acetylesterase [Novosphingobium umbonatum]